MTTILVRIGKRYYKAKVNPMTKRRDEEYARLCGAYVRQQKRGRLASMIYLDRRMRRLKERMERKNPLIKSRSKKSIGKNIRWLKKHPKELTAKTKVMRHKQAIAIALSVWRKASGMKPWAR